MSNGTKLLRQVAAGAGAVASSVGTALQQHLDSAPRRLHHAVTVLAAPDEVYRRWRDLASLPAFMAHLERVDVVDDRRSHWAAHSPGGATVQWDAEIVEDEPGRVIAWRAAPGSAVQHHGRITFAMAPGGKGTEVRLTATYVPLFGGAGVAAARLAGESPVQQTREDLRRFKAVVECGEHVEAAPQPSARGRLQERITAAVGQLAREEGR